MDVGEGITLQLSLPRSPPAHRCWPGLRQDGMGRMAHSMAYLMTPVRLTLKRSWYLSTHSWVPRALISSSCCLADPTPCTCLSTLVMVTPQPTTVPSPAASSVWPGSPHWSAWSLWMVYGDRDLRRKFCFRSKRSSSLCFIHLYKLSETKTILCLSKYFQCGKCV